MNKGIDHDFADALPDGIVCINEQGQCLWWNVAASHLLSILNEHPLKKITDIIQHKELSLLFSAHERDAIEIESPFMPDRWLHLMVRPYRAGQTLLIVQDVTLTRRLDTIRKDFIANVSHELRTPLTVLRGYLEILQDIPDMPKDKLQDVLAEMSGQSHRMQNIVQDLLLLSRLESVEPDTGQHVLINVASMLRTLCVNAQALSGKMAHEIVCEPDESLEMLGQTEEIYSAFSNLIFNAVHYTPERGRIYIKWYGDEAHYILLVKDNGVGITEEDIPKLTQRFYRTDKARAREQHCGGTGLGLAIVKHVLLRHQGELHIKSEPGVGSEFYCFFPRAPAHG